MKMRLISGTLLVLALMLPMGSQALMPDTCQELYAVESAHSLLNYQLETIITTYGGNYYSYPEATQIEYMEIVQEMEYLAGRIASLSGGC
jgi:hypothetical protein